VTPQKLLLEQLLRSFSENNGALLRRFLRRFQYAASVPASPNASAIALPIPELPPVTMAF
jgi:hypothetical protein